MLEHGVENNQQLAHASCEGQLLGFTSSQQPLVEVSYDGVEAAGHGRFAMRNMLVLLAIALVACGEGRGDATPKQTPIPVTIVSGPVSEPRPLASSYVPTPYLESTPTPTPVPRLRATFSYPSDDTPWSIEEETLRADLIARVQFVEAVVGAEYTTAHPDYPGFQPLVEVKFRVLEYLKGSGPNEIVAVLDYVGQPYTVKADVLVEAGVMLARRDTQWDSREAIVFLKDYHEDFDSIGKSGRYWMGNFTHYGMDGYTIASQFHRYWLPAAATTTSRSRARGSGAGGEQQFLLGLPNDPYADLRVGRTPPPSSTGTRTTRSTPAQQSNGAMGLSALKARINAVEAEITAGDGSDEYANCVFHKYRVIRKVRELTSENKVPEELSREIASGQPSGTAVFKDPFPAVPGLYPNKEGRYWASGADAELFAASTFGGAQDDWDGDGTNDSYFYGRQVSTVRPLPAGTYGFFFNGTPAERLICNGRVDEENNLTDIMLTVTAGPAIAYEAMFDPVADGSAVKASSVLKPYTANGADAVTVSDISWESGTLKIGMDPVTAHAGKYIDFIDVDGELALPLKVADATVDATAKTLSWTVADAPWEAGDKVMLRIYEKVASTCTVAEGAMMPGACYADLAFASSSYGFPVYDIAAGSSVGSVSVNFPDLDLVTLSIISGDDNGHFAISETGEITTVQRLDYDTTPSYTLTVQADAGGWSSATTEVAVTVSPVTVTCKGRSNRTVEKALVVAGSGGT